MRISEYKRFARENLKNRWGKVAVMTLIYILSTVLPIAIPVIGVFIIITMYSTLEYGYLNQLIKFKNGENVGYLDIFKLSFANYKKVFEVKKKSFSVCSIFTNFLIIIGVLMLCLPLLLLVPPLIFLVLNGEIALKSILFFEGAAIILIIVGIKLGELISLKYKFVYNELVYNPDKTAKEIVKLSSQKMKGNKTKALLLDSSFIGWILLSILFLGIPLLFVIPYKKISNIIFYEELSKKEDLNDNPIIIEV